jgi:hypothetical protein
VSQVVFDVPYTEARNRGTTAIRIIMVIPHAILLSLWQTVIRFASVVQWVMVVFTGKRNKAIWDFTYAEEGYASRVGSYAVLLHDVFPAFLTEQGSVPSSYSLDYPETADRLSVGLRIIYAIPAFLLLIIVAIGAFFVAVVSWFTIVITGNHPRGMFDFLLKFQRYALQTTAYLFLLTDSYPKY